MVGISNTNLPPDCNLQLIRTLRVLMSHRENEWIFGINFRSLRVYRPQHKFQIVLKILKQLSNKLQHRDAQTHYRLPETAFLETLSL